jgi:hypothetical protein
MSAMTKVLIRASGFACCANLRGASRPKRSGATFLDLRSIASCCSRTGATVSTMTPEAVAPDDKR